MAGGTDGGDRETLLANARALATTQLETAIVIAGNREAADEAEEILRNANFPCQVADNVLPRLGRLEVDGARQAIRELFLKRIVLAKGLQELEANLGEVVMPTPAAVLAGLELYAAEKGDLDVYKRQMRAPATCYVGPNWQLPLSIMPGVPSPYAGTASWTAALIGL